MGAVDPSRSLVIYLMEEHSETMMGKLVSEAWQQNAEEAVVY